MALEKAHGEPDYQEAQVFQLVGHIRTLLKLLDQESITEMSLEDITNLAMQKSKTASQEIAEVKKNLAEIENSASDAISNCVTR